MSIFDAQELYLNGKIVQELYLNGSKVYPKDYIMLSYIQSYGKEYIDTGVHVNPNYTVSVDFMISEATTKWDTIFGTRNGNYARFTARFANATNAKLGIQRSRTKTTSYTSNGSYDDSSVLKNKVMDKFHNVTLAKHNYYFDGVLKKSFTTTPTSGQAEYDYSLYLFGLNNQGAANDCGYFKISHCSITDENGELVRDFYPCQRIEDGEYGMLDKVTGEFYGNQGSGAFTGE